MTFALTIKTPADLAAEARTAWRAQTEAAVETRIEAQARALGYSSAAQLASYAASTVPEWAAEARTFVAWRDAVWLEVHTQQNAPAPGAALPSIDAVLAALPAWPNA